MKSFIVLFILTLASCGYDERGVEMVGQIKRLGQQTPIFCSDYDGADISLGVMRNGVGSMSTHDVYAEVTDKSVLATMTKAAQSGALVKMKYDDFRACFCRPCIQIKSAEILTESSSEDSE